MEEYFLASTPQLPSSRQFRELLCTTSQPSGSIVIIEKKQNHALLLAKQLKLAGLKSCMISQWCEESHSLLPDMLVLVVQDQNVPMKVVWERCQKIRQYTDVPISILLSGMESSECISNVSIGGKPFSLTPLDRTAMVPYDFDINQNVHKSESLNSIHKQHGSLFLDPSRHQLRIEDRTLALTPSEYKILEFFMTWPGRVFSRDELISVLYDKPHAVVPRVVDVHISNLRKKIEPDLSSPMYIQSVRGLGYQFLSA